MDNIYKLMQGQITKEEFLEINAIINLRDEIERGLAKAYQKKSSDSVEKFIYLIFVFELFKIEYVNVLNKLLLSDWHYQHENIALLLQKIASPESLEFLYKAIELKPKYLEWDENHAFEVKCIRGLYQIGKRKSFSYLQKLCGHPDHIIREMAQRQTKKLEVEGTYGE